MIDWTRGYRVTAWRLFRVNPDTWADSGEVGGMVSATVSRTEEDEQDRGTVSLTSDARGRFEQGWHRIAMTASQSGSIERVDVATLWLDSTGGELNRGASLVTVNGSSVLHPCASETLETGSYAPRGVDGAEYAADLIRSTTPAPVVVEGSFTIDEHVVFDSGATALSAARLVLDAGNFIMQVDGRGVVHIHPRPSDPVLVLDASKARLMQPSVTYTLDYSEVPNRYIAEDESASARSVNDDPNSPTSTVSRGWVKDIRDTSPIRVNGETLTAYTARRLMEESTVHDTRSYTREWWPDVHPGSIVRGTVATVGEDGLFRVESQQIDCNKGITVQESSYREVVLWQTQ